ncbi:MAG: DinB family protein, partial [Holophagales bacterium]|nr:DinB family protein [Holophagales bacterium]
GVLPSSLAVRRLGGRKLIVPQENADEAAVAEGVAIYPMANLRDVVDFLNGEDDVPPYTLDIQELFTEQRREEVVLLGDLVRHLAALERYMFAENVSGRPSLYAGCGRELAEGYEAVVRFFEEKNAETVEILGKLDPDRLRERCETPGGASIPVWKWLRAMVEHHAHHRGQIYLLLGLMGVATPPLYGLTAEQVQERSAEP